MTTRMTCHSVAVNANARLKRRTVLGVLEAAAALGRGDGWVTAECVLCGSVARRDVPRDAPDALEVGHVVADAEGGCYGLSCNLVPMCYTCNRALGDEYAGTYTFTYDTRPVAILPPPAADPGAGAAPARDRAPSDKSGRGRSVWTRAGAMV